MKKTRSNWLITLFTALAALTVAACDDRPPNVVAVKPAPVEPGEAKSPKGAAAGTAEEKMLSRSDATKPGTSSPDQVLAEKVKAALGADPALEASTVDVVAANGVVTLVGTADNTESRDKASRVASNVQGVSSVQNRMVVVRGS